jgi:hypothetical protein
MEGGYGMVGAGVISCRVASRSGGATDTAQPRGGYTEEQLVDLVKGFPIPAWGMQMRSHPPQHFWRDRPQAISLDKRST